MTKFPTEVPKAKVIQTLQRLGFQMVREREQIAMLRVNSDGSSTPLTLPNHPKLKGATLRTICTQAGISRQEFLHAYQQP